MVHVDTANILNTLRSRHKSGAVYTSVGNIVVSVNPYRWIDIYSKAIIREHFEAFGTKDLMPHVFTLASDAYKALCTSGQSQTIITSGESGAGKTENAKQVFRFLAEVAGVQSAGGDGHRVGMDELLIHANPVLEAFGNAKTLRNDNSSRFGKLVTVHFDISGRIIGATNSQLPAREDARRRRRRRTSATTTPSTSCSRRRDAGRAGEAAAQGRRRVVQDALRHHQVRQGRRPRRRQGVGRDGRRRAALGFAQGEIDASATSSAALLHLGNVDASTRAQGGRRRVFRDGQRVAAVAATRATPTKLRGPPRRHGLGAISALLGATTRPSRRR